MKKETLNIGVLGAGPIAQFAHFESCQKGRNVRLYAICDTAEDLLNRMKAIWQPEKICTDYAQMLADPNLDAVIIATADAYHVPLALMAVRAGKHVLVEKPLSHSMEECKELDEAATKAGVVVQIGHMKRFDPGIEFAKEFIDSQMGNLLALKTWYADNNHRYTTTDNVQPMPIKSENSRKSGTNEKENLERYYMMAHGSHLLDTAMHLGGKIGSLRARLRQMADMYCWFIDAEFENGAVGHLDLTVKIRGDWHEGFHIYGEKGTVFAKTYNPWFYKSSDVECYLEEKQQYLRPLSADGFTYRRQLEHFADVILSHIPQKGTNLLEGMEITKGMLAIKESLEGNKTVYLDQLNGTSF